MTEKDVSLFHYRGCIPQILAYQAITKAVLTAVTAVLNFVAGELIWSTGRSAATSGDLPYLMRSWQGWILLLIGLSVLVIYTIFDINAMVLLSDKILHQGNQSVWQIIREAFSGIRRYRSVRGVGIILFAAFAVPLIGAGTGISLTSSFYMPNFITSAIHENILYQILYSAGLIAIAAAAFLYAFTFQFMMLQKKNAADSMHGAIRMMKAHWRDFLKRYLLFLARTLLVMAAIVAVLIGIALILLKLTEGNGEQVQRYIAIFFGLIALVTAGVFTLLFVPFHTMEMNRIYESYAETGREELKFPPHRTHTWMILISAASIAALAVASYVTGQDFDTYFPQLDNTQIIAHRAGGNLGAENTVSGLEKAIAAGAGGAEVDVQRTLDGYYVINHDNTFRRLCGVNRSVSSMTLAEIRQLTIPDTHSLRGESDKVATLEEMLDAAKGKIHLYVELKGSTADRQMADDLYQIVKDRDMLDDVTFISLSYTEISYLETQHADANTGYLCYASFGDLEDLNCDELILEEETATAANIEKIHDAGKKADIWTVDQLSNMVRFMARQADGIITNEVEMGIDTKNFLHSSGDSGLDDLVRIAAAIAFVYW